MASTNISTPEWVVQLESPPAAKAKASSIPDPPGFSGAGSKVRNRVRRLRTQTARANSP